MNQREPLRHIDGQSAREPTQPEDNAPERQRNAPRPRRILVVDDNRDSATSLCMMLELMGNDARSAFDGMSAVEQGGEFRPDVILLDIGMPGMNGYDTARKIREQEWGGAVRLLALTGWSQDSDRKRSEEAGFDGHIVKPIEPGELEKLLEQ